MHMQVHFGMIASKSVNFPIDASPFNAEYTLKGYFFSPHKCRVKRDPHSNMGYFKKFRKIHVVVGNFDTGWEFPWYLPLDRMFFFWLGIIVIPNRYSGHS